MTNFITHYTKRNHSFFFFFLKSQKLSTHFKAWSFRVATPTPTRSHLSNEELHARKNKASDWLDRGNGFKAPRGAAPRAEAWMREEVGGWKPSALSARPMWIQWNGSRARRRTRVTSFWGKLQHRRRWKPSARWAGRKEGKKESATVSQKLQWSRETRARIPEICVEKALSLWITFREEEEEGGRLLFIFNRGHT